MRRLMLLAVMAVAALTTSALAQFQSSSAPGFLEIPFDVTAPGGLHLPAGTYEVRLIAHLLKRVGRASVPIGRWPGPEIHLYGRISGTGHPADDVLRLATETEARVVYDLPGEAQRRAQVRSEGPVCTAVIRGGRGLEAIVVRGDTFYITGPSAIKRRGPSAEPLSKTRRTDPQTRMR